MEKTVLDRDGTVCIITDMTDTSIEVLMKKKTDKGIDCKQWFTNENFNKRFSYNYGIKDTTAS